MRLNFPTRWIVRGWITLAVVNFYAQNVVSKSLQCDENHYLRNSRCCMKCGPGSSVFSDCTDSRQTVCLKCNRGEYQPGWTEETRCLQQKFCDPVKGFMETPENLVAEEPCHCVAGLQCYPVNCEYCERIPACRAGSGLELDAENTNGRKKCVPCKKGFFSSDNSAEHCKQWTNCKAEGRSEAQPGGAKADAVCGPPISGAAPSWVIVSVLPVITVLCLLILLLFCYKDKLKLLSVNLRSCVQNLKRTTIQQETLAPLYHSGAGGEGHEGPRCTPCETTKLICQAPHSPTDGIPCTFSDSGPDAKVSLALTGEIADEEGTKEKTLKEDQIEGSGEPEEVSEKEEVRSVSLLLAGSCACVMPIREPLEVGENEDCSQAVSPGSPGTCSCRGLDGDENRKEEKTLCVRAENNGNKDRKDSKSEAGVASLVSVSPPLLHNSAVVTPSSPELPFSQLRPKFKSHLSDRSLGRQEDLYSPVPVSTDSTSTDNSTAYAMTLVTSSSVGDLYLDKSPEASSPEQGQGLNWGDGRGKKLSSVESELQCTPESLHSQLAEPTLTSGQVSGNHNTTFISSGKVMNFSGDVIVVYVSQTSLGSDGTEQDDAFGSPVQEEADETAPFFQNCLILPGESISHSALQDATLPVQEVVEERPVGK
ncbi:tumor necrosis factor receptor superfamily member 11A [Brachionichthys hirsutus]|uniref:tumor necrosis factor receptor superfamily member 11A n=1 Tax=Brachionichthys hirsutus TaxID=412623 RepID=UPI0036046EBE